MKQRREKLLQSIMFLLLLQTLALSLLTISITAEPSSTCRQEIPAQMIRELWSRTRQLIDDLPKEEHFSQRLLPKFCTRCSERKVGWLEMRDLIDVYQRSVFSRKVVQQLLPLHYNNLLYRLQHTLQNCVWSSKPSKQSRMIEKLERKIEKRKRDERALKAVREFTFVLRCIGELAHHRVGRVSLRNVWSFVSPWW